MKPDGTKSIRYASACSGIEAASVAWHSLGWTPAWFSEIEKFPCAVLAHHYPSVPNLGDMTRIAKDHANALSGLDLIVAGTPCQSFSVAGLRKGLADPRGNLALVLLGLIDAARPKWLVWENVPGVLSSSGGRDFGSFLGALGQLGYGWAYRVLDAQYVGVPQRRRRVFVVGCLGDWRSAAAVLFERHSLSGNPAPSREAGPGTARDVAASLRSSGAGTSRVGDTRGQDNVVAVSGERERELHQLSTPPSRRSGDSTTSTSTAAQDCLSLSRCMTADMQRLDPETETLIPVTGGFFDGPAHSLTQRYDSGEDGCGRGTPLVPVAIRTAQTSANGHGLSRGVAHTLDGANGQAIAFDSKGTDAQPNEISPTLCSMNHSTSHANAGGQVAIAIQDGATRENPTSGPQGKGYQENVAYTLEAREAMSKQQCVATSAVRRLTPRECERLQGFPDNYTLINFRGKPAADGPRYKALGNSMAVPVMSWIGKRIALVRAYLETLTPTES